MSARRSALVIRPYPAAQRTAAQLAARGFEPFVLPLSAVRPVAAVFARSSYDAALATSANAFLRPLPPDAAWLLQLPLYCVGRRAAQAAHRSGFSSIAAVAQNADALCAVLTAEKKGRALYLAGRLRRPVLETCLRRAGIKVDSVEVYETQLLTPTPEQCAQLPQALDFILLYSAASVAMLASLADRITPATGILCLSGRIAEALSEGLGGRVQIAGQPTENALFSLLSLS